jgi:transcriptional regulator with PAS, ATPase and Fis domain
MQVVYSLIEKVCNSDVPVLISGESGTGKELVARAIHFHGHRNTSSLVVQNCSAFSDSLLESEIFGHVKGAFTGAIRDKKGLFEVAHKGTFFLDELGEMSMALQAKLLRVLQDGKFTPVGSTDVRTVDVRIVAATNRNLEEMIEEGTFREDLYYRLNVVNIALPPLRERKVDIPYIIEKLLADKGKEGKVAEVSKEVMLALCSYDWPGNVRELRNEVERMTLMAGSDPVILREHLSERVLRRGATPQESLKRI